VRYFAVVTNRPEDGLAILQWHRAKAGTVEHTHHVLKTELAAAALPSGQFGANAAGFRLTVLPYHLLTALTRWPVPPEISGRPGRRGSGSCASTPSGRSSRLRAGRSCGSRGPSSMPSWSGRAARSPASHPLSRRLGSAQCD
jgi:hypothetical protein